MNVTATPSDKSTVVLDVELPAATVQRAIDEAVRHLGERTKVPGFRPGKVPRPMLERALGVRRDDPDAPDPVYDDAKEHLYESSVVEAITRAGPRHPEHPAAGVDPLRRRGGGGLSGRAAHPARRQARRLHRLPLRHRDRRDRRREGGARDRAAARPEREPGARRGPRRPGRRLRRHRLRGQARRRALRRRHGRAVSRCSSDRIA